MSDRPLFGIAVLALVICQPLVAAKGQLVSALETEPHLSLAFPFEQRDQGVGVKYPLLVNKTTVIPTNAILRVIYNPPRPDDAVVLAEQSRANRDVAYSKLNRLKSEQPLTAQELAVMKLARETHWPNLTNFQLALANLNSRDLRIVFVDPETREMSEANIALPEGLLLASVGPDLTVLAVEKTGRGKAAGMQPGDVIREIGGVAMRGANLTFAVDTINEKKRVAELSSSGGIPIEVTTKDGEQRSLILKPPASLGSGVLDVTLEDLGGDPLAPKTEKKEPPPLPKIGTWNEKVSDLPQDKKKPQDSWTGGGPTKPRAQQE